MDSKLLRRAISACVAILLLVLLVVFYMNKELFFPSAPANKTVNAVSESVEETVTPLDSHQKGNDLRAFLKDSTFFDEDNNKYFEEAKDYQNRLSLIVTSIEKDLRIQIVDFEGNPVAGQTFFVNIEGMGDIKDLDQDGVIYVGDLSAGDYYVKLNPIEGYRVPETATRVMVKDKVEYLAISDISLLIKTEADIDAEAEDTRVFDDKNDADKTENRKLLSATGNAVNGIDVSKWQGEIDWDKVKNAGVKFAIIRAGYRGSQTGALVEDPYFEQNMKGAINAGIKVGAYFFTQAVTDVEAVEEASVMLSLLRNYNLDFPVFIDTEGAGGNGRADSLDATRRTSICEAFCRTIENAGLEAGIYASRNWYNVNLYTDQLDDYFIWLAEYRSVPLYQGYYQMWQHSSKGTVDGIKGNVDLDIYYPQSEN